MNNMVGCKIPVNIVVSSNGEEKTCRGFYHSRGCMGARYPHLDLEPECINLLRELGFKHGLKIPCRSCGECCVLLDIYFLNNVLRIRALDGCIKCLDRYAYVMITRSRMIYLGNICIDQ